MHTTPAFQRYVRRLVYTVAQPDWSTLEHQPRPWLCLHGGHSETLLQEVRSISRHLNQQWVWRGLDDPHAIHAYRQGPLLVPLDAALYAHALVHWLPQQAGLIVLGPEDGQVLLQHLQRLRTVVASDGFAMPFSLHAARALEELCEALPAQRLAQFFGPIQQLIWHTGGVPAGEWLCADAPARPAPAEPVTGEAPCQAPSELRTQSALNLTESDEAALDQASHAWLMRDCAREFRQRFPAYAAPEQQAQLWQKLLQFVQEARAPLGFTKEADLRHYMALRLAYPPACFAEDSALWELLMNPQLDSQQRLSAAQAQLQAWMEP
jgi:hypothetical protein